MVVQVDYFDQLGRLKQEKFYPSSREISSALIQVAGQLAERGVGGTGRLRERKGSRLTRRLELEQAFLKVLAEGI